MNNDPEQQVKNTETAVTGISASKENLETIARQVYAHERLIPFLWGGILASIIILALDIVRNNDIHTRITELEKEVVTYRKEILEQKTILSCLKFQNLQSYLDCF